MCPFETGDRVSFVPAGFIAEYGQPGTASWLNEIPRRVTGTVVQVNEVHRWYRVQFEVPGKAMFETFKF